MKWEKLLVGDYRWGNLVFERKADYQFIQDRNSKQLFDQIGRLLEWCKVNNCIPCLISECDNKVDLKTQTIIEKMLRTLGKDIWCIRSYLQVGNENSTASVIMYYIEKFRKGKLEKDFIRVSGVRGRKNDQVNFLCGFSKIDDITAKKLLKKYGSVIAVLENVCSWADDIDGVGKKIQEKAIRLLWDQYNSSE